MQGIVVLGFPKCGTTSIIEYLNIKYKIDIARDKGFSVLDDKHFVFRREWCYLPFEEQLKRFEYDFGDPNDFKLVFITRNKVDRIWSGWEAWHNYYAGNTFEEYLHLDTKKYNKIWITIS